MRRAAPALLLTVALLAAWEAASAAGLLSPLRFPAPSKLASSFYELAVEGFPFGALLGDHALITLQRVLTGYVLAVLLAVPLGLLIGSSLLLDRMTAPVVAFCRSVATLSLLPLSLVWFGTGEPQKVFLIFYGCFWVMLSNVIAGIKLVDPLLLRAARSLDTKPHDIFFRVMLPAALPRIAAGARVALGMGFVVIVGAEMIGTTMGLGALIMEARTFYRSDITLVGMACIGAIGFAIAIGLTRLEAWLMPWQRPSPEKPS
ncbi:ABC transporter permease [Roseomonas sp. AR75]|uniref:ABC transporter permease n=1 Tax=Roseomonas sp. AR75 TaxID=2562311 RepID=UPI001484D0D2|nr:ABC transporter permease [Roseomonas sp. AR75]